MTVSSFIIAGYVLGRGTFFPPLPPPHPGATLKMPILNRVNTLFITGSKSSMNAYKYQLTKKNKK